MYSELPGASASVQVLSDTRTQNKNTTTNLLPAPFPTRGVRARLGFLRPNHPLFRANIIIHQISNIPFKTGAFAVRWRFKDVQIPIEGQLPGSSLDSPQTPARGITPFIERDKQYAIVWSYTLKALLKLGIDRETAQMSPCPLKLTVLQRVNDGDPWNAPQSFRVGAVYLDLAQFVGHGSIKRWYLLRESKTNAIIKLTLKMEYVSGDIPPPLGRPEYNNVMEVAQQNPPGPVRYARAQQEYLAKQMAEVIAEHDAESPKIEMLSRPGVGALEEVDDQHLKGSHFNDAYEQPSQPPLVVKLPEIATSSRAHVKSHAEPDDELSEESYFDPYEQSSPSLVVGEHGGAESPELHRSRTSSNSSYASARTTMSVSESLNASYYTDDTSLYSIASSRTAETDYGLYYRRMALSQSTIDSGRTAELRRCKPGAPVLLQPLSTLSYLLHLHTRDRDRDPQPIPSTSTSL